MTSLILVPLDDSVVFPTMDVTLPVDVGDEDRVLLIPRHDNAFAKVGTIAEVTDRVRLPGGALAVQLSGVSRGVAGAAQNDQLGRLRIEVTESIDTVPVDGRTRELEREYRAVVEEILELRGIDDRVGAWLRAIGEPGPLADTVGYAPDISFEDKVRVLETLDVTDRLELAVRLQRERLTELQLRQKIRDDVREGADKQQREYFLRKQMESIQRELGEDSASVVEEYRAKIDEAGMPEAVEEQARKELGRLERMGEQSGEASMIRSYLDWLTAVPWKERSDEVLDPVSAREVLDADHAGLEDVKDRIVEYLAVKKLRVDRGLDVSPSDPRKLGSPGDVTRSGAILTLIGPAGTGKTSIGDPSAALLEVLDPAQNHSFRDHYLDVELDLSEVMFIATANVAETIPGPLLDRMEVIRFDGYTVAEKTAIARDYLWPRQRERNGLREDEVSISDELLTTVVTEYTREAGVRQLERELGTVLRKTATKVASQVGRPDADQPGQDGLVLTGQLGDVMKESARIALSYVRGHAADLGIDDDAFDDREFHVHVPAGAIPKDGPSAGITMTTALASLLSGRPVRHTVGMTV